VKKKGAIVKVDILKVGTKIALYVDRKKSWVLLSKLKTALCRHKRSWVDIAAGGNYVVLKI
jgi:hypothetical protein